MTFNRTHSVFTALLCFAASLLAVLPAAGQQRAGGAAGEDAVQKLLRFYYISYATSDDDAAPVRAQFQLQNADKIESLSLGANTFSPLLRYRGPVPIALFREVTGPEGVERVPLASLDFPSRWQGVLFLALHDPAAAPGFGFRFFPVEYGSEVVPQGSVRFVNLARQPLAVQLGQERGAVASGEQIHMKLPDNAAPLTFRVAERGASGEWRMHVSSVIPPFAKGRALVIFYPATADGHGVRVLTISNLPQ